MDASPGRQRGGKARRPGRERKTLRQESQPPHRGIAHEAWAAFLDGTRLGQPESTAAAKHKHLFPFLDFSAFLIPPYAVISSYYCVHTVHTPILCWYCAATKKLVHSRAEQRG